MSRSELIGHPRHLLWKSKNARHTPIKHMDDGHLTNTINFLGRSNEDLHGLLPKVHRANETRLVKQIKITVFKNEFYMRVMRAELEYRKKYGWPEEKHVKTSI